MIMKKLIQQIFACLVVASVMTTACTDDLGITGYRPSDVICFTATLGDQTVSGTSRSTSGHLVIEEEEWRLEGVATDEKNGSRATIMSMLEGNARVLGYKDEETSPFMDDVFQFNGDELTTTEAPVYWKDINGTYVHLYAYAPKEITDNGGLATLAGTTLKITVPIDVTNQKDIIAESVQVASDYGKSVPMTFDHILTAIRFKAGFDCIVKSITVTNVANYGEYVIGQEWSNTGTATTNYTISFGDGKTFSKGDVMTVGGNDVMMLIPQILSADSKVVLVKEDGSKIEASIGNMEWKSGKLITFTLYKDAAPEYIYLDLAAADVVINADTYSGAYYDLSGNKVNKTSEPYGEGSVFYVYQSTEAKRSENKGVINNGSWISPGYEPVKRVGGQLWRDYIINNNNVNDVINSWVTDVVTAKREGTWNRIQVNAANNTSYRLVIDDVYSTYQYNEKNDNGGYNIQHRQTGGIAFAPIDIENCVLTITTVGDNRLGNIHYATGEEDKGSRIIFEGEGSLTVADVDLEITGKAPGYGEVGYYGNWYCSAIGGNDSGGAHECCRGIVINSGVLFAGSTVNENCSAIGGGGNGIGEVTINGGIVTAVASTTGTAIGGGIGYSSYGGEGIVTINGGNVYAYNLDNKRNIPSSAIGGAGSSASTGTKGTVKISGGYVYAYSALGTAIGGGSSQTKKGGDASITISGGTVIARSDAGAGIGGGSACTGKKNESTNTDAPTTYDGGTAKIEIWGNPILRTGSIGGGSTGDPDGGKIGSANITISGGDIQAQFVLAAGAKTTPSFIMNDGVIRNSNVIHTFDNTNSDAEYKYVKSQGGAIYLEDGTCTINGGTIENCIATKGGAIYITGQKTDGGYTASFTMNGGTIKECTSTTDGGAVYLKGGNVTLTGGTISDNLAQDGNGGAFYITEGNFEMSNATITENSALHRDEEGSGNGGGVYITSSTSSVGVNLLSGSITNNTSDRRGGGVCVIMPENKDAEGKPLYIADVVVGTQSGGPDISSNATILEGGGLYVEGAGTFEDGFNSQVEINEGRINGNSTTAYVPNENVVNKGGIVTLNGGDVPHVVVTFHGNGGTTNSKETDTQLVVTATNNVLVAPEFSHGTYPNLKVRSWNTRADGQGTTYLHGGLINVNASIDLYAQWGQ